MFFAAVRVYPVHFFAGKVHHEHFARLMVQGQRKVPMSDLTTQMFTKLAVTITISMCCPVFLPEQFTRYAYPTQFSDPIIDLLFEYG